MRQGWITPANIRVSRKNSPESQRIAHLSQFAARVSNRDKMRLVTFTKHLFWLLPKIVEQGHGLAGCARFAADDKERPAIVHPILSFFNLGRHCRVKDFQLSALSGSLEDQAHRFWREWGAAHTQQQYLFNAIFKALLWKIIQISE